MVQQGRPRCGRCPGQVVPEGTRFGSAAVRPDHRPVSADRITDTAANQDVWYVLARAGTDSAPRTLAAAQNAVFRRYLPMARTLATNPGSGSLPVDPADAELGWLAA